MYQVSLTASIWKFTTRTSQQEYVELKEGTNKNVCDVWTEILVRITSEQAMGKRKRKLVSLVLINSGIVVEGQHLMGTAVNGDCIKWWQHITVTAYDGNNGTQITSWVTAFLFFVNHSQRRGRIYFLYFKTLDLVEGGSRALLEEGVRWYYLVSPARTGPLVGGGYRSGEKFPEAVMCILISRGIEDWTPLFKL